MTWSEAKPIAAARVALMIERLRAAHAPLGTEVRLTLYDAAAWTLFGDSGGEWSREDHDVITRACARRLREVGYRPRFFRINGNEYLDWLVVTGRDNTAGHRALFANEKQSPP